MKKLALVSFGNEESYGLLYAGTELKKHGEIRFFDAEMSNCVPSILNYSPDYLCFSPMTTFFRKAKDIEQRVKHWIDVTSIFGGHHATNCGEDCGDITIVGSVHGFDLAMRGRVDNGPTLAKNLKIPARAEYFRDIPRMASRYRKVMLSVTGCPFRCTYCSSVHEKENLVHRDIDDIIEEAKFIKNTTHEIEWVDDDIFYGDQDWLIMFLRRWQDEIGLPMYVSTTSINALATRPEVLLLMRKSVNCIGLGVQAVRPESLKLLGRAWDSKEQIKKAYDYLTLFGFRVNLQGIVGLPVAEPVEDALDTVNFMREIGAGSIASVYPLQIYPNTAMQRYCLTQGWRLNKNCGGDTNSGLPAIDFGDKVNNQLRNICKLATMVIKFNISRDWLESMVDIDLGESSKKMSMVRYFECINDRLPDKAKDIYSGILSTMNVRY